MIKIYPSLISADLLNLEKIIKELEPHCSGFHIDIMDFHFVPNLTWGPAFVNAIRKVTNKQLWIDLLVEHPEKYLERMDLYHNDIISIHYESTYQTNIFKKIREQKCLASLALDPATPVEAIIPFLDQIDHILLMSVKPGFSGQKFIPSSIEKIKKLNELRTKYAASFTIGMDGGLNEQTLSQVKNYGLDNAGIASAIFNEQDPIDMIKKLT